MEKKGNADDASINKPPSRFGDINGDGKVDFNDVAQALKSLFKSQEQKDKEDYEKIVDELSQKKSALTPEAQNKCDRFKAALESTIDLKFADIMKSKDGENKFLTYIDAQIITASVKGIFIRILKITPVHVVASCHLSEVVLAPTIKEKQELIKAAIGVSGGAAGIGMVIVGVGAALGWGASVTASVIAFFTGASVVGPVGWIIMGVSLAAVAGYFAYSSNEHTDTERFISVLKSSLNGAVDSVWEEFGESLSRAVENESKAN